MGHEGHVPPVILVGEDTYGIVPYNNYQMPNFHSALLWLQSSIRYALQIKRLGLKY